MAAHYRVIASYSTVPQMLDEADFLLALVDAPSSKEGFHKRTLAASAAVVLAVCLDQGTLCVLDTAAQTALATKATKEASAFEALLSESLRRRVVRLPEVLTNSKFQLDSRSLQVQAIHALITLRNDLMHVNEEADVSDFKGEINLSAPSIKCSAPSITNRWLLVRPEEVQNFRTAVELYVQKVLFPASNTIREGKIVIRR
jgi:hypothetical protein